VGAFLGALVVYLAYLPHWEETTDQEIKLAVFCTGPSIRRPWANCLTEILATAMLLFVLSAIVSLRQAEGVLPLLVGGLVWALGLSLGGPTAYALNPARDLGPRIAHALLPIPDKGPSDWGYAWVPVVGPMLGGLLGWGLWVVASGWIAAGR
jgi:glycerol uptake facilitator protein